MLRWFARLAIVATGAVTFTLVVSVAAATPLPHANPSDIPPSTVADHGVSLPLLILAAVLSILAATAAVALARRRTT